MLEETNSSGTPLAWHTLTGPTYGDDWLHVHRLGVATRYPLFDGIGTVRELVDGVPAVTDTYTLDAFGKVISSTGTSGNPYRFGGDWGYLTDTSGMLQLGHRFYWPEIGRFVQQDPIKDTVNWYVYAGDSPVRWVDPTGLYNDTGEGWYWGTVAGWGDWWDAVVFNGATQRYGDTAGRYDAGNASKWDLAKAGADLGWRMGLTGWLGG